MDSEEITRISREEAEKRGLTLILSLKAESGKAVEYLAYVAHPRGGTTVMEAHRILKQDNGTYELKETTAEELRALERKYSRGSGNSFDVGSLRKSRIS